MAAYDFSRAPAASSSLFGRLGATLTSAFVAVADWNDARITRKALNSLTDRELDDIGLCRGDVDAMARHS